MKDDDKISEKHTYIIKPMKNKRNQNTLLQMWFPLSKHCLAKMGKHWTNKCLEKIR